VQNETSSCWVRVAQNWAGGTWGHIAIPRIGQEVVVEYLEGDPDQPIITGRTYHGTNRPPYALPEHKTRMTIKSQTHKGEGFNELRFEDEAGREEVFMHAQKDQNNVVLNNETTRVGVDRTETVGNNETITIGVNRTEQVGANEAITIGANKTETVAVAKALTIGAAYQVTVGAAMNTTVGAAQAEEVGLSKTVIVGDKFLIRAGDELEIIVGDSALLIKSDGSIRLTGTKIEIRGGASVKIDGKIVDLN
jgi:type VI secretion system secreted protein VgrG